MKSFFSRSGATPQDAEDLPSGGGKETTATSVATRSCCRAPTAQNLQVPETPIVRGLNVAASNRWVVATDVALNC
jgi:hypothetical protein